MVPLEDRRGREGWMNSRKREETKDEAGVSVRIIIATKSCDENVYTTIITNRNKLYLMAKCFGPRADLQRG